MKRITVGRGNDCDVVILDETDNVSRHHMVITFNFFGKIKVSDTSSNGTFINGVRMLKGTSIPVTTDDRIRLGRSIELDWNLVRDPYKLVRIIVPSVLIALVIVCMGIAGWSWYKEKTKHPDMPVKEVISADIEVDDNWNQDSTAKVAPTVISIDVNNKNEKKVSSQKVNRKKKDAIRVNKSEENAIPSISTENSGSELDSVAVF